MNNRINNLPPLDLLVTWPAMEDALKGVYREPIAVYDHAMQTLTMTEVRTQIIIVIVTTTNINAELPILSDSAESSLKIN